MIQDGEFDEALAYATAHDLSKDAVYVAQLDKRFSVDTLKLVQDATVLVDYLWRTDFMVAGDFLATAAHCQILVSGNENVARRLLTITKLFDTF